MDTEHKCCCCETMKTKHRDKDGKEYKCLISRLNRIEGQVRGVRAMSSVCVVLNALRLRFFKTNHITADVSRETLPPISSPILQKEEVSTMIPARILYYFATGPAQPRIDDSNQFFYIEWLSYIIIGTDIQPHEPICFLILRRKENNGNIIMLSYPAANFKTIYTRHHDIQYHNLRFITA